MPEEFLLQDQQVIVSLIRTIIWAATLIIIVMVIAPVIRYCVNRSLSVRELEIRQEKELAYRETSQASGQEKQATQFFYYQDSGQEVGPISAGRLKDLAARKIIDRKTQTRREDGTRWRDADQNIGLFD